MDYRRHFVPGRKRHPGRLSSDARKTTAFAISSGLPSLPRGTVLESILIRSRPVSVDARSSFSPGVSVEPGDTALTRMWRALRDGAKIISQIGFDGVVPF